MPSAEHITATVNRYLDLVDVADADGIAQLYATDATIEDPVGGEVHIGRQVIHGFYSNIAGTKNSHELHTLRACGHEAAFFWSLTVNGAMRIDIISTMNFDADGAITAMKAYWGPENITQL
ncbi:steroid delta-isomerase [Mycobacterium sp. CBMA 234]|uniref:nuclear transport factor 2 family protein n=1 Tax=Mycolicibacterium sp. CBMA 234 TaxID=1918495 RepID=UPI0012DEDB75|nr:nuclear transport factor 2 family protein [Mycolicibacterium sp. CBMA 234]MUL66680.1 steroid delta-isomerase [Mycolicibacterium sp. CBMA 234]